MSPAELIRSYRPCGECRGFVPAVTGCKHWRPKAETSRGRKAKWRANLSPAELADLRERNRQASQRSRDRARQQRIADGTMTKEQISAIRRQARWLGGLSPEQAAEQRERSRVRAQQSRERRRETMTEQERAELRERNRQSQQRARERAREMIVEMGRAQ